MLRPTVHGARVWLFVWDNWFIRIEKKDDLEKCLPFGAIFNNTKTYISFCKQNIGVKMDMYAYVSFSDRFTQCIQPAMKIMFLNRKNNTIDMIDFLNAILDKVKLRPGHLA